MPKFKVKANVEGQRTGRKQTATITMPAKSERAARAEFERDMRFIGQNIDGPVTVERLS